MLLDCASANRPFAAQAAFAPAQLLAICRSGEEEEEEEEEEAPVADTPVATAAEDGEGGGDEEVEVAPDEDAG